MREDEKISRIVDQLEGRLSQEDKIWFDQEMDSDVEFRELYGQVKTSLFLVKAGAISDLKKDLKNYSSELKAERRKFTRRYLYPTLAALAACLLLFLSIIFVLNKNNPQQLSQAYINQKLLQLPVTMSSAKDSLQTAINYYNRRKYKEAENIFISLEKQKNLNSEVYKYLGLLYLVNQQFDQALYNFDKLSEMKHLYANPGPFYKAITLMNRGEAEDLHTAEVILKDIVQHNSFGSKEAAQWLDKF